MFLNQIKFVFKIMLKSSELAEYIKKNAKHSNNGTYEVRNICFEVDVPYVISYLD